MQVSKTLTAIVSAGLVLAGAGVAAAAPAPASDKAAQINAGLQAMRELNVIALKDLQSSGSVQGRTFVGGNLTGSSSNYMTKPGAGVTGGVALTVAGNVEGSAKNINNGGALKVGGNIESGANMNGGGNVYADGNARKVNANGAAVYVDGNVEQTDRKSVV
jgi:choice-of-anchor A domain-containing protein